MKVTPKRKRSDSAKAAIEATKAAAMGVLAAPEHITLRKQDKPFWTAIVQSRAADTWTDSDLATAATMARAQADIEGLQKKLDDEGYVCDGKINPTAQALEMLSRRVVALSRVLHVHAQATVGRSADASKALELEKQARQALSDDDDLIPTLRIA